MAKDKKVSYGQHPHQKGDLWTTPQAGRKKGGCYSFNTELTQADLKYLHDNGFTDFVYEINA